MSFDASKELDLLNRKIAALTAKPHLPADLRDVLAHAYAAWLPARARAAVSAPGEDALASAERRAQGAPMLPRELFPVDLALAGELFDDLLADAAGRPAPLGPAAAALQAARQAGDVDLTVLTDALKRDDPAPFQALAARTPEAPGLLRFLVQTAAMPSIETVSLALAASLDPERTWPHGHCPVCGSLPFMSHLREKEGYRYLSCSFCHADWRAPRVACAFCGETKSERLPVFSADEEPGYRLDVCETCRHYLKTADFRALDRVSLPLFDDFESLGLDLRARQEGFERATLSGFGI